MLNENKSSLLKLTFREFSVINESRHYFMMICVAIVHHKTKSCVINSPLVSAYNVSVRLVE